jgi:DNA-binding CsgD family transcriptional regulator
MPDFSALPPNDQNHRRAPRQKDAEREASIFLQLRAGLPVLDIARAQNCSQRTVRRIVARTLARRERDATGGYAQLQIERLNDALMVASLQMVNGNLKALDRVLKVMQAQDRYHGFGLPGGPAPALPAPADAAPARRPPRLARPEPQRALPPPDKGEERNGADKNLPITP